jgi:Rha family phage regulatory protein
MNKTNLVTIRDNKPVTTSLLISKIFNKRHDNIIRDVKNLISETKIIWRGALNFEETSYVDEQGKHHPCYNLTRDGFTLLSMGFTGKKALEFKIKYIEAFNAMEEKLRGTPSIPSLDAPGNNRINYLGEASVEEFFRINHKFYNSENRYIFVYEEYSEWARSQMLKPVKKDTFLYYLNKLNFFIYGNVKKYDSLLYYRPWYHEKERQEQIRRRQQEKEYVLKMLSRPELNRGNVEIFHADIVAEIEAERKQQAVIEFEPEDKIEQDTETETDNDLSDMPDVSLSDLNQFLVNNPINSECYRKLYKLAKQFAGECKN